jgi:predicted pyridoxine 5'-phosphate oxidase superfamily flavin-nucleotide-binding protein
MLEKSPEGQIVYHGRHSRRITRRGHMTTGPMYHDGSRRLQDRFATRRLADRLVEVVAHDAFTDADRAFIESRPLFFLATADAEGRPDCSYKGGLPGFVRVVDPRTLAFPSYDGNGMFKSLGNILVNPSVGMLFIDFESPGRLRVNGRAAVNDDDPLLSEFAGAQLIVRVQAQAIFPNCPRYIHRMRLVEHSPYAPREAYTPPVPDWKRRPEFREVLPPGDPGADPPGER